MRAARVLALVSLLAFCTAEVRAQTLLPATRPKIGLALGGGSARSAAHIGVLLWLEEHHVPVDLIAGTSAGGLVGGAYATGMPPSEIRALMASVDWDVMLQADAPYALKDFRRKEDARAYPAHVEFGLRHGFRAPSSLAASEQVDLLLSRIAQRYYRVKSFDELPLPFRCVATDLVTEELVVLGDGSVAEALRATIAFPGLFPPVRQNGRVLVDGGVIDNVPADVVRAMGAGVVIAVDVGRSTPLEPGLDSAITVLNRTLDVLTDRNTRQVLRAADIVIKPDLEDIATMDWQRYGEIADRGYRAAAAMAATLTRLSVDDGTWAAYVAAKNARRVMVDPVPTSLMVVGVSRDEESAIRSRFARYLGHSLDERQISRDLTALTGSARYEIVTYHLAQQPDAVQLVIEATPRSYGPPFLRFGLDVTNTSHSLVAAGVRGRLTAFDVAGHGSEVRLDAILGAGFELAAELYKPIAGTGLFVAPSATVQRSDQDAFQDAQHLADYRTSRASVGADVGVSLNRNTEFRLGVTFGHATASAGTGQPDLPEFSGAERMAHMQVVYDGQDQVAVPSHGLRLQASFRHVFRGVEPQPAYAPDLSTGTPTFGEVVTSLFMPVRRRHRIMMGFSGGTSFNAEHDSYYAFTLGGPLRLRAYDVGELRGRNYLLGSAAYLHDVGRLPDFLGGPIYLVGAVEVGGTFGRLSSARFRTVFSTGLVMDTMLGPVSLTGSVAADGHYRVYVNVGRTFR
jgi:NTE family protein